MYMAIFFILGFSIFVLFRSATLWFNNAERIVIAKVNMKSKIREPEKGGGYILLCLNK